MHYDSKDLLAPRTLVTLTSAHAPAFSSAEDVKDAFFDLLDETLCTITHTNKILLLGNFNARVSTNNLVWGTSLISMVLLRECQGISPP